MNWIWRCSNCNQTCTRLWNLKIHIQRKHCGLGRAIKQNKRDTTSDLGSERFNVQSRNQNHIYSQQIPRRTWPNIGSKGILSKDFDNFLGQWCGVSQIMNFAKQSSPSNMQYSPKWPVSYPELFGFNVLGSFLGRSFHLAEHPLMEDVVMYEGYICRGCLMACIIPTYGFKETGKTVEVQHDCDRRFVTNDVQYTKTNNLNISNEIGNLNQKLLKELNNIVNKWTDNKPCLRAIQCTGLKELVELPTLNKESHSWVRRTILVGQSILSDLELLDFLKTSGNKTCSLFNLKSEEKNGSYFM